MYDIKRRSKTFDTGNPVEMKEYEEILNNPLCSITYSHTMTTKEVQHDPDSGKPMMTLEHINRVVEWDEKTLF